MPRCPACGCGALVWRGHAWLCDVARCRYGVSLCALFADRFVEAAFSLGQVNVRALRVTAYCAMLASRHLIDLPWLDERRRERLGEEVDGRARAAEVEERVFHACEVLMRQEEIAELEIARRFTRRLRPAS